MSKGCAQSECAKQHIPDLRPAAGSSAQTPLLQDRWRCGVPSLGATLTHWATGTREHQSIITLSVRQAGSRLHTQSRALKKHGSTQIPEADPPAARRGIGLCEPGQLVEPSSIVTGSAAKVGARGPHILQQRAGQLQG